MSFGGITSVAQYSFRPLYLRVGSAVSLPACVFQVVRPDELADGVVRWDLSTQLFVQLPRVPMSCGHSSTVVLGPSVCCVLLSVHCSNPAQSIATVWTPCGHIICPRLERSLSTT